MATRPNVVLILTGDTREAPANTLFAVRDARDDRSSSWGRRFWSA